MPGLASLAVDAVSAVTWWTGFTRPLRCHDASLTIATFHRVLPAEERARYPFPGLAVTPTALDFCLSYFTGHYDVGPTTRQLARFRTGERTERPLLAITFDDGQLDNYLHAAPVLEKHGVRGSFYVPLHAVEAHELLWHDRLGYALLAAASSDAEARVLAAFRDAGLPVTSLAPSACANAAKHLSPDVRDRLVTRVEREAGTAPPPWGRLMHWDEVRELHARGHEIGSHSVSHELMPQLDEASLEAEATRSKRGIEAAIGAPVASFCYPNGDFDARAVAAVERAGYDNAVTTRWGTNRVSDLQRFALRRCDVDADRHADFRGRPSSRRLAFRMSGLHPGLRPRAEEETSHA